MLESKEFRPTDNSETQKKEIRKSLGLSTNNPINYSKNEEHNYIPPDRFYTEKEEVTPRSYRVWVRDSSSDCHAPYPNVMSCPQSLPGGDQPQYRY